MRGVSAITAKLWLDRGRGPKMTTLQFHIYPPQPPWLHLTWPTVAVMSPPTPPTTTTSRSTGSLRIVYSALFVVTVHWGISYKWTGIWQGLYDVGGRGGAVCWESPISSGGRAFWSVGPHSTPSPAPSFCLCLPVFPHRSSPPARLTDRQMLSAVHLQLWASITLHKQPIACTQAANSVCLSPFR